MRLLAHLDPWSAAAAERPAEEFLDLMLAGAAHDSPHVRYWAMVALGARHTQAAVPALIQGLGDPVKMVREAARFGLRQTLLDDQGWNEVFAAYEQGGDLTREQLAAALVMRADAVMPQARVDLPRLAALLDQMMSRDASPAARAWAARAAWNWWVWNPPTRARLNQAFLAMLEAPEPSALAENAKRYQLQALFIANGNRSAANYDNPYPELAELFGSIAERIETSPARQLMSERLTRTAATYYSASYGSNGTGQLGYATPRSSEAIGKGIENFWNRAEAADDLTARQLAIEAAANVIHEGVQTKLLYYSVKGPEALRPIASSSLSDPRAVLLPTSPEFVEPLLSRIYKNAESEEGRRQVSRSTVRQLSQARWDMPMSEGRQREFFQLLIPKLDDPASDVQWFLAEQLGRVLAANPDFRTPTLQSLVPQSFRSPLEEMFWLPSTGWMLTYDPPLPELGQPAIPASRSELRRFALDFYLRCLSPEADRRVRTVAVSMLYQPALHSNPEVAAAAARIDAGNFRRLLPGAFARELRQAAADDKAEPKLELTSERLRNFEYFRDFVVPELARENRADGDSCFSCHGGGKVPSMSLEAPDRRTRFLAPRDMWSTYRTLLERIDPADFESSKLLRKPLNIQTGKEDGHQGGLRYKPGDFGYQVLKRWAQDAARLKQGQ
jgi:HEAT repeat protein